MLRIEPKEPLTCDDLIARGLANETHCCELCHNPALKDISGPGMQAYFVPLEDGDAEVELCCAQALTINAYEYISGKREVKTA